MKITAALVMAVTLLISACGPDCVRTEPRTVHHDSYMHFIHVGDMMVPIFHSAYDAVEDVCVEYAPESK